MMRLVADHDQIFVARKFAQRVSFAFETTLSGRGYARLIPQWRAQGYRVELFFQCAYRALGHSVRAS